MGEERRAKESECIKYKREERVERVCKLKGARRQTLLYTGEDDR